MIKTSVKNNVLSILRDPTTILAFIAAIIMRFMNGFEMYRDATGNFVDRELFLTEEAMSYALNSFVGFAISSLTNMSFPFLGNIVAINIFKDMKNNASDIIFSVQMSFPKYFLSKILSYHIIGVLFCLFLTLLYSVLYACIQIPPEANLEWGKLILAQIVAIFVIDTSYLLIPTAWAVLGSALTGVMFVGTIFNCIYLYLPNLIAGFQLGYTFWGHYIHVFPHTMYLYLEKWITYPKDEFFTFVYKDSYGPDATRMFTSFSDALLSYALQILIAAVLFTASYFLLKRRFQKS